MKRPTLTGAWEACDSPTATVQHWHNGTAESRQDFPNLNVEIYSSVRPSQGPLYDGQGLTLSDPGHDHDTPGL